MFDITTCRGLLSPLFYEPGRGALGAEEQAARKKKEALRVQTAVKAVQAVIAYCEQPQCRRKALLGHFGEAVPGKVCVRVGEAGPDFRAVPSKFDAPLYINGHTSYPGLSLGCHMNVSGACLRGFIPDFVAFEEVRLRPMPTAAASLVL